MEPNESYYQYPSINPSSEPVESDEPSNSSHFYTTSLPAEPLNTSLVNMDNRVSQNKPKSSGRNPIDYHAGPLPSLFKEEDLNQIDSFTDIVDTLHIDTLTQKMKEMTSPTRSQTMDITQMATPLGPSQVDIGNLCGKKDLPYFITRNPQLLRKAFLTSERRACSAMMVTTDPPTIFINESSTRQPKIRFETEDPDLTETEKIFQMCKVGRQERSASLPSADISVRVSF